MERALGMTALALGFVAGAAVLLALRLHVLRRKSARAARARALLAGAWPSMEEGAEPPAELASRPGLFLDSVIELRQCVQAGKGARASIGACLARAGYDYALIRRLLRRGDPDARAAAAARLAYAETPAAARALALGILREPPGPGRVAIAEALGVIGDPAALPSLIDALAGSTPDDRARIGSIAIGFGDEFLSFVPALAQRSQPEILELLFAASTRIPSHPLGEFVRSRLDHPDTGTRREARLRFIEAYADDAESAVLVADPDPAVRSAAIARAGSLPSRANFEFLVALLASPPARADARNALSDLVSSSPYFFGLLVERVREERDPVARGRLLAIVSLRVEYCLARLADDPGGAFADAIGGVLDARRTAGVVNFLNRNRDPDLEDAVVGLLARRLGEGKSLGEDIEQRLDPRILGRLGLRSSAPPPSRAERNERVDPKPLAAILALIALAPPIAYFLAASGGPSLAGFVGTYIEAFTAYALALNGITAILLALSFALSRRQSGRLARKTDSLLFLEGMLPSISVIAPAYNEEATIIESVRSLMNLRYPDYEVIVVNDGSRDKTLELLVGAFDLAKRDASLGSALKTSKIRGVYSSPRWPALLVVDKENGGKADSLNAGINAARKRLFAGIDSDSLLERDALLRVAAAWLDYPEPVIAAGGNILPVNDCAVSLGDLAEIRAPRIGLPLFQAAEYLRAFMNGRLGWSALRSLLIISGAFGLFDREAVIEAGGYLTSRERYVKDTVGEDMELVVRLTRAKREAGLRYRVHYEISANCWTEVPDRLAVLRRQRNRWQRGLLDILSFHRKLIGNPRYGTTGVLAFPYFLLFEVVGPWFETFALIATAIAPFVLPGWLFAVIGSFAASVLLGVANSLASLAIAQWDRPIFRPGDQLRIAVGAVIENFGYRQLTGLFRLEGYLSALRGVSGWGAMTRRGFAAKGK